MYEQRALDALMPEYNIRKIAESNIGLKWSDEVKAKMGAPKRGKKRGPISEELRAVLSAQKKEGLFLRSIARRSLKSSAAPYEGLGRQKL